jgi:outer membrane protein assembly factor BamD (BamD/ComL family)
MVDGILKGYPKHMTIDYVNYIIGITKNLLIHLILQIHTSSWIIVMKSIKLTPNFGIDQIEKLRGKNAQIM